MTQTRPIPIASDSAQQRLELELLLKQAVPEPAQLKRALPLLENPITEMDRAAWSAFPAMPVGLDAHHLDLAVPSHWNEADRSNLISRLSGIKRELRLHPTLESDLNAVLALPEQHKEEEEQTL